MDQLVRPPRLTGAAAVMFDAMSDVSQAAYDVLWTSGTEYGVWRLLTVPRTRWGRARSDHADVAPALGTLELLAVQAGCWAIWPPGPAPMETSLDYWQIRYQAATEPKTRKALA